MRQKSYDKLGTTFHRSFSLNRPAIGQILRLANSVTKLSEDTSCLSQKDIRENTVLGSQYVTSMPRYGQGAGLLTQGNCLTGFGKLVVKRDPMLDKAVTQWIMHYHLSVIHSYGPLFWNALVTKLFRIGNRINRSDIDNLIHEVVNSETDSSISANSARQTATAFIGTYTKTDGLDKLGILADVDEKDLYLISQPPTPSPWVFAYALMDYWATHYEGRLSVNLDDLLSQDGLASLFLLDTSSLNQILSELQQAGVVDIYRSAPPYQLLLLLQDKSVALDRLY